MVFIKAKIHWNELRVHPGIYEAFAAKVRHVNVNNILLSSNNIVDYFRKEITMANNKNNSSSKNSTSNSSKNNTSNSSKNKSGGSMKDVTHMPDNRPARSGPGGE